MRSDLVGFLFPNDALLQADGLLEVNPGLNVVYGLNGAGKSRLLRGITNALRGIESDINVALVIRVHIEDRPRSSVHGDIAPSRVEAFGREPAQAIAAARASARDFEWEMREFAGPMDLRSVRPHAAQRLLQELMWERLGATTPLSMEIAADAMFLFSPTGASSAPSWDVWPVADSRRPEANAASTALDSLADAAFESAGLEPGEEDPTEALEAAVSQSPLFAPLFSELWSSGASHHLIKPSPFIAYDHGLDALQADQVEPVRVTGRVDFGLHLISPDLEIDDATREHFAALHAALILALQDDADRHALTNLEKVGLRLLSPGFRARAASSTEPAVLDWSYALTGPDIDAEDLARIIALKDAEIASSLDELIADLEVRVNHELSAVLIDAPRAKLRMPRATEPFSSEPIVWSFGPRNLPLEALSRAEQQWATRTINEAIARQTLQLALGENHERHLLHVIDEPEGALHRAAESHMAAAIRRRANSGAVMLLATHSPELLDAPEGSLYEVKKNLQHGRSLVQRLDMSDRDALHDLGLVPSDLLRWPRVILLVEGEHDEVLLEALLGDRLRQARVKVIPLHGGAKLAATVDSQVLFDHTDAHVVALLDNLRVERLSEIWQAAVDLAIRGDIASAREVVIRGLPDDPKKKGQEAGYMRTWLVRALDRGLASRATPYALGEVDIIRYLPVSSFVPNSTDWADLDEEHQRQLADKMRKQPVSSDFKKWLTAERKVSFPPAALREAAAALNELPRDFERLMKTLEALSTSVR